MSPRRGSRQATADAAGRHSREAGGALRRVISAAREPDSYGLVLLLILASMLVSAAPGGSWTSAVAVLLRGITLLVALWTSRARRRVIRVAAVLVAALEASSIAAVMAGVDAQTNAFPSAAEGLLVAAAMVVIAQRIASYPRVTARSMLGALCIYLLLGLLFTSVFVVIDASEPQPFFGQAASDPIDFLYFSFVTLTTLGYGDLSPAGDLGRMVAVVEALLGQIYLVTVVATIVGNIGRQPPARTIAPQHPSEDSHR